MANDDAQSERQRLAEIYAAMADGELQLTARDAVSLTDEARQVLQDEFARRSLTPEADLKNPQPSFDVAEFDELVILKRFRELPEAIVAKGFLDAAGIECFLVDEYMVRADWFWSNLVGGVKLCVREKDEQAALEILDQSFSPQLEIEGVGTFDQPSCPKCQSFDLDFQVAHKGIAAASAWLLSVPFPVHRGRWKCNACGSTWNPSEDGPAPEPSPTM